MFTTNSEKVLQGQPIYASDVDILQEVSLQTPSKRPEVLRMDNGGVRRSMQKRIVGSCSFSLGTSWHMEDKSRSSVGKTQIQSRSVEGVAFLLERVLAQYVFLRKSRDKFGHAGTVWLTAS